MATITLQGNPVNVSGSLPAIGTKAPAFSVTGADLSPITLDKFIGKKLIINIFPSIDTGTCAAATRQFNTMINDRDDVAALCVSQDLPFAASRFCGAEGLDKVITASTFRSPEFLSDYGVKITDSPMAGLCARSVVVLNEQGEVIYTQLVSEVSNEPDYDSVLNAIA